MDGIININKPPGKTSFSIVAAIKHLSGERRVGHAGTLDPAATGVLPVCLGRGTRFIEFLMDTTKTYRACIELGVTTDTYDGDGRIIRKADPSDIRRDHVASALEPFRGLIEQTPPMFSAVKHKGQPLYKLARAGIEVERKSRVAQIHRLEMVDWQPPLVILEVECGKGTYIRSLAHDLGQSLGCGAYLKSLVRTRCGIFNIDSAVEMLRLEEAFHYGYWRNFVFPVDEILRDQAAVVVNSDTESTIRQGKGLVLELNGGNGISSHHEDYCRAYTVDGRFLGVLRRTPEKDVWQPKKVLP